MVYCPIVANTRYVHNHIKGMVIKFLSAQKIVQKTTVFAMYICLEQQAVTGPAVIKFHPFSRCYIYSDIMIACKTICVISTAETNSEI